MMAIFTALHVVRRAKKVRTHWKGLLRLSGVMAITVGLIIAEPDLGATVVIVMMMGWGILLQGAPPTQFLINSVRYHGYRVLILFEPIVSTFDFIYRPMGRRLWVISYQMH